MTAYFKIGEDIGYREGRSTLLRTPIAKLGKKNSYKSYKFYFTYQNMGKKKKNSYKSYKFYLFSTQKMNWLSTPLLNSKRITRPSLEQREHAIGRFSDEQRHQLVTQGFNCNVRTIKCLTK